MEWILSMTVEATRPIGSRISTSKVQREGILFTFKPPWMTPMLRVGLSMMSVALGPIASSMASRTCCCLRYRMSSGLRLGTMSSMAARELIRAAAIRVAFLVRCR